MVFATLLLAATQVANPATAPAPGSPAVSRSASTTTSAFQHAALHPPGAELYAEVPDAGAALAAYARAPLVQMVSSESAAAIADVSKELGFDLRSLFGGLLPVADPTRPDDRWWPWSAARTISFSAAGIDGVPRTGEPKGGPGFWMIADFATRDAAQQAEDALVAMGGGETAPAGELVIGNARIPVRELDSPIEAIASKVRLARIETRLVVCAGAAQLEQYVARSSAPDLGLAARWSASTPKDGLGAATGVVVLDMLVDMDDLPTFVGDERLLATAALVVAPFLAAKGRWRIELVGDRFLTTADYEPRGPAVDVWGAFGSSPLDATARVDAQSFLPPDAVGTWITNVDAQKAEVAIGALFAGALGDAAIAAPAEGQPRMADGLGRAMAMSLLPMQSLMSPAPRLLLTMELSDTAKFQAGLEAWIGRAQAAQPALVVERRPHRKVPTIILGSGKDEAEPAGGASSSPFGGVSLEPTRVAIAILADRVVFASTPTAARGEIKRHQEALEKGTPTFHEGTRKVARPADAVELSTMDWGAYLAKLFDGARGVLPMFAQNRAEPLELGKLPTGAQLFAPFRPSTSWSRRSDGRIQLRSESSFGPETPLAVAALGFLTARAGRLTGQGATEMPGERAEAPTNPATAGASGTTGAAGEGARTTTLAALREVRTAIAVYRSQAGRAPQALADLLQKTDAFPDGFLKSGKVPTDGWERELVYAAQADGSSYALHSKGPDGVDQQGAGDDVRLP